ncbi:hypothetical protein BDV23DRAFT_192918 [Aspergillus alliaceus]|uniref:Zn(2)-C6 fungal-type domain-containing protein n=1 Tax=Petromyces alliaceus TaxID=209559 RepID=A0A5N7CPZ3_PETAA|nr:hypothetical protein BDV23DRAFT_192918 [Aspergillus alliaceus]
MESETTHRIRSRRAHQKSRLGCKNCKRRRVKCDEKKPSCTNCLHHSIDCDFSRSTPTSLSPSAPAASPARHRYRFKESKYQTLASSSPNEWGQNADTNSVAVQCNLSASDSSARGISFADLELFHHYTTSTYRTLSEESIDSHRVWLIHLPQWGISFPSILHLLLALAALHLCHQQPDLRRQYVMQADDHFTFGVRSVTAVLSQLNSENCQLIYMSAVLISLVYFGHGPRSGEYLVFSDQGRAEWLVLMRGVRSILSSKRDEIFSGILEPQSDDSIQHVTSELQAELLRHCTHIAELKALIDAQAVGSNRDLFIHAVNALPETFEEVYKMRSAGRDGVALLPMVIGWIYRRPEPFVVLLEEKEPLALLILAYWSILLKYMTTSWLFIGWDEHVIKGIRSSLNEEFLEWIQWPEAVIRPRG